MKDRLKQIRVTLGYNQTEIAEKLGFELSTYRGFEYKSKNLPLEFLNALISVFNININWLLTGQGPMFMPETSEKQQRYEQALSERKTIGQRLNWLQGEEHLEDEMLAKETGIEEKRIRKIGLDELEPTVSEVNEICNHFGVSLDLFINGRALGASANVTQALSAEEKKMLEFLKKAKENKLI